MIREIKGDLWDYYENGIPVCITTNGFIKKNGELVMGAGVAKQAKYVFPELPKILGDHIRKNGNRVYYLEEYNIFSFPTKHYWWQKSDIDLIKTSLIQLTNLMEIHKIQKIILPRPGAGNGRLHWNDIKEQIKNLANDNIYFISN